MKNIFTYGVVPQGLKFDSSLRHARSRGVRRRRHQKKVLGRTWNGVRERKDVLAEWNKMDVGRRAGGVIPGTWEPRGVLSE